MKKIIVLLSFSLLLSGCATNYDVPTQPVQSYKEYPVVVETVSDTNPNIVKEINEEDDIRDFLNKIDEKATLITKGDINLNGKTDFLVETVSVNCGSCHGRPIYLFEDGIVAFEYQGDDYSVVEAQNNIIKVREPIRLENEPMCCPSTFQISIISCPKVESQAYCRVLSQLPEKQTSVTTDLLNSNLSNDNSYINVDGNQVHSPAYAGSVPSGASAICRDGTYSFSQHRQGTCSGHGGVASWY